ncbi:hypothetical protein AB0O07_30265 [Streptomyces sp. NPDC093085]
MLLTYDQVRAYELPATEGKGGDLRWSALRHDQSTLESGGAHAPVVK